MSYYVPGTTEKDVSKVIMSLQQAHEKTAATETATAANAADIATNTADIAANTAAIAALPSTVVSSIAGNTGAFTLGRGITNSTNEIRLALNEATINANPSNPSGTSSGTPVMMGLGSTCTLTPVYSTRIRFAWSGVYSNTNAGAGTGLRFYYGTGSAPSNGAATTGTQVGPTWGVTCPTAGGTIPFSSPIIVTGLTPSTAYWFDIAINAGSNTSSISAINFEATEF